MHIILFTIVLSMHYNPWNWPHWSEEYSQKIYLRKSRFPLTQTDRRTDISFYRVASLLKTSAYFEIRERVSLYVYAEDAIDYEDIIILTVSRKDIFYNKWINSGFSLLKSKGTIPEWEHKQFITFPQWK